MNKEFLQKLGINDEDPNEVYSRLGEIEIELLDKRDLAETNGVIERVKEIDSLLEQLKEEREKVKEEAKSYITKKVELPKVIGTSKDKDKSKLEAKPENKVETEKEAELQKNVETEKEAELQKKIETEKEAEPQNQIEEKNNYTKMFVFGKILFLVGTIYLFKGLHPTFFNDVIPMLDGCFPNAPEFLIIKWDGLLSMTEPYMTHQGVFGGWLIIFGCIICSYALRKTIYKGGQSNCRFFGKLINDLIIFICIFNIIVNIGETSSIFGNGSYMQFVLMIGCILIGRLIGNFIYNLKS